MEARNAFIRQLPDIKYLPYLPFGKNFNALICSNQLCKTNTNYSSFTKYITKQYTKKIKKHHPFFSFLKKKRETPKAHQ